MAPKMTGERTIKPSEQKALNRKSQSSEPTTIEGVTSVSYDRFPGKLDTLPELAAEYLALMEQGRDVDARKREIREVVEALHADVEELVITGDFFKSEVVFSHTMKKLNPVRVMEKTGATVDELAECWDGGEEYSFVKISAVATE